MSTTVDSKVVEMKFDNRNFENNVATTMTTLSRLKQSLNFTGATKGLEEVASATDKMHTPLDNFGRTVDAVRDRFSALEVMAITALSNIANSAVNAGKKIASALTIDPIKTGFQEYETQINAVQTILANTKNKGTTLDDVNGALDELNTYADKTIYNFTEMTRNIGTFTAAGVDLDTSVSAIKGIANLAAVSGSTSQQASTAMYQLSQALASGTVKLMDWNSVVNAGMGGQVFQDALKETARIHGVKIDEMIKTEGSFRETLKDGWLTSDILTETLSKFTGDLGEAELKKLGYNEQQIKEIMELGEMANDAATKVKTLTQLWDTMKEAAQSGWSQSWEIIVGDFEEAKALFTEVSDIMGKMIGDSAKSRNEVLQGWKDMGGRADLIESFRNVFEGVLSVIEPIKNAFRDVFPPATAETLFNITENLKKFTEGLVLSSETSGKVERIFKGLFSIFDLVKTAVSAVLDALLDLAQSDGMSSLSDLILDILAYVGDFFTALNEGFDSDGLTGMLSSVSTALSNFLEAISNGASGVKDILSWIGDGIIKVVDKVWSVIEKVVTWLSDNLSAGDVFAGLAGGGIFMMTKEATDFFDSLSGTIDKIFGGNGALTTIKDSVCETLSAISDALKAFTTGVKVWSIVGIAVAMALLTNSLETLSKLPVEQIAKSLIGIGIMISMLMTSLKSITKTFTKFESSGVVKGAVALILIAEALNILADAMVKIGKLSLEEIGKGLVGIGGGLIELAVGLKIIGQTKISLSTSIAMIALAESCCILGDALQKFGQMTWGEIGRGLSAMGGALAELVIVLIALDKFTGSGSLMGSVALLIAVQGLGDLADALKKFGEMAWGEIGRGLTGMGGALGELGIVLGALGKFAGISSLFAAGAIVLVIQGLDELADALMKFGYMAWDEIARGLVGMGGALAEVAGITGALGKIAGISSLFAAGAILITIQGLDELATALKKFGEMTWDEIARGLAGMGGALGEVAIITGVLGKLTGLSGILGAGSILLAVQSLGDLADAFKKFGGMTWEEIARGLVGMGGALGEVAIITGALGALAGLPALIGSGSILLAVQGLGDIADALKKFGEMSWDEIGRGLSAMGGALGELALGGFLNSFAIIGSYSISEIAEPLGTLADSVKKWKDVTVPEGLGWQLTTLANGVFSFTFDGAAASAISTLAAPLGTLADSVKKWKDVTVPEGIGDQLDALSDGIFTFIWDGTAASVISTLAAPLGVLADSVKKWSGVTVPETIGEDLKQIAGGIQSFSWAFMGGWSIGAIVDPLSKLPDAIKKWKDVSIPDVLKEDLTSLADGIKAFSWTFTSGWSISSLIDPLTKLPDALKKWKDISVPEGLEDSLKAIADGINQFGLMDVAKIQLIDDNILSLSTAFTNLASINVTGETLVTFAKNVKACGTELSGVDSGAITTGATTVNTLVTTLKGVGGVDSAKVKSFVDSANLLNKINISDIKANTSDISSAVKAIQGVMKSITGAISSSKDQIATAMSTAMSGVPNAISSIQEDTNASAKTITEALRTTVSGQKESIAEAFESVASAGVTAARDKYDSFKSAGSYLVSGFAAGISENSYKAAAKAKAMAQAAEQAAKDELAINSPSKVFRAIGTSVPEGFAQGISKLGGLIRSATNGMAGTALNSTKRAISRVSDIVNTNIDTQPTIRPVVDLSEVKAGADAVGGMFSATPSVGVLSNVRAINTSMNARNQNGANDEVVSAIKDLKKNLNSKSGDTYHFGDFTYSEGTEVADAVKTIVRAIRVGGRV